MNFSRQDLIKANKLIVAVEYNVFVVLRSSPLFTLHFRFAGGYGGRSKMTDRIGTRTCVVTYVTAGSRKVCSAV